VTIPKEVAGHYAEGREAERLASGRGELERVRTQAILARYLPPPPATVLDVGGAAGVYAIPLAKQGYAVHLVDPVELHVAQAREAARRAGVSLASAVVGDARRLEAEPGSADAVLMLGPLYHLVERGDRRIALREALRVLKPRGVLFAAAISRFASFIDGIANDLFADPVFRSIVAGDLAGGRHENPTNHPDYFTTAYFHRPEELGEEVYAAGFC
jgi:ubiquinone/menaquinone biosynthesis C-methylase UbiE